MDGNVKGHMEPLRFSQLFEQALFFNYTVYNVIYTQMDRIRVSGNLGKGPQFLRRKTPPGGIAFQASIFCFL